MNIATKANDISQEFKVALDGPAASGKGHIARMMAEEFSLEYVQSSIVYRGLSYICLKNNILADESSKIIELAGHTDIVKEIAGIDLNREEIGEFASKISVLPEVRTILSEYLKEKMRGSKRIIMEGRDIGTVIARKADLKLYITADVEVRAERRYKQLISEGKQCMLSEVLDLLKARDERDYSRSVAPLRAASDAFIIDTSKMTPEQIIQEIKNYIESK